MDLPKPARTNRTPGPARVDTDGETLDLDHNIGAARPAKRADADAATIAPPHLRETITQTGPCAGKQLARQ